MHSTCVQSIGRPSTIQLLQTKRPGYTAGPLWSLRWSKLFPLIRPLFNNTETSFSRTQTPQLRVEMTGFEPVTFALQRRCSPAELHPQNERVGLTGFEPVTPVLSGLCSNQLSYKPVSTRPQQLRSDRKTFDPYNQHASNTVLERFFRTS